jgi:hypothetical protein
MGLFKWVNAKIKNLKWYDMSLTKLSVMAVTLMLVRFWPPLASLAWYWYLILFVVFAIVPMYKLFKK